MHRQLIATLGRTLGGHYAAALGWPRTKACAGCGKSFTVLYRCTRCRERILCGKECQTMDWAGHKHVCTKIAPLYEIRDFLLGSDAAGDKSHDAFKKALLGPGFETIASAVFALDGIKAGACIMRGSPGIFSAGPWDPANAVGSSAELQRANCRWTDSCVAIGAAVHVAPRLRSYLVTTREVLAGERLTVGS